METKQNGNKNNKDKERQRASEREAKSRLNLKRMMLEFQAYDKSVEQRQQEGLYHTIYIYMLYLQGENERNANID